jgi:flagellar basal-body rod modification protein FlgD
MDQLRSVLSTEDQNEISRIVTEHNAKLNQGRAPQQSLGKDEFLKILITQLSYQDPMAPMEDKEFIAQMAQFSSLEQMRNMAQDMSKLASMLSMSEASAALGKSVEIAAGDRLIQGPVKAVTREASPQVLVNGALYSWEQVNRVFE